MIDPKIIIRGLENRAIESDLIAALAVGVKDRGFHSSMARQYRAEAARLRKRLCARLEEAA
jgi:hypothetical protein